MSLTASKITMKYGEKLILDQLNIKIPIGKITVFLGSNGCGKSTLLRSMARLLKPATGTIILDGKNIHQMSTKQLAKQLAILPQNPSAPSGLTVLQLVKQGRYCYQSFLRQWSKQDEKKVMQALKETHMEEYKDVPIDSLSGGQKQRAWIAMTLAQDTNTILLDEPTTYLDVTHQIEILDLLFELNEKENRTIIMVLHDINLACRYAHHIVALKDKKVFAEGKPEDVISPEMMQQVFDLKCQVVCDPIFCTPMCIPTGKGRKIERKEQNHVIF
ncbi:ABC transporter ATP-binding protein [Chengkuizengella sediminis]|uniref:ABC transporter ATP-binding protein n=1 Tax=Chengkuizengella sediminis TaxID=1885917 RepID=UPI00138A653A|nr:ABC transporter ATP-binding protein [Chengkuizengella sediminis]NDI36037.1 ABC transporter ATP-binding protein [Chengkuizengella sediminis]